MVLIPGTRCGHLGLRQRRRSFRSRHRSRRIARLSRSSGEPGRGATTTGRRSPRVRPITRFTFGTSPRAAGKASCWGTATTSKILPSSMTRPESRLRAIAGLIVWNLRTGAVRRVLEGHEKDVLAVVVGRRKNLLLGRRQDPARLGFGDRQTAEPVGTVRKRNRYLRHRSAAHSAPSWDATTAAFASSTP